MTDHSEQSPETVGPETAGAENEVVRAVRESQAQKEAADAATADKDGTGKRGLGWKTAAGIGIGSAALLAAVLFANREKS